MFTFFGGPIDGAEVPEILETQPFIIVAQADIMYYYVRCDEGHSQYEYTGEDDG